MGGPPNFEPEDAHELCVLEFSDGDDVAAAGLGGVEAEEAAGGGEGFGGGCVGTWGGCYVFGHVG